MDTAIAAVVAVIGTLLGSVLTYQFQQRASERTAALDARERSRQERLDAYAAFGGAAVRCRAASLDLYHRRTDGSDDQTVRLTQAEFFRARAELTDAELRVQLVSHHTELDPLMAEVIETSTRVRGARDLADRNERNDEAKAVLSRFVRAAASEIGPRNRLETS